MKKLHILTAGLGSGIAISGTRARRLQTFARRGALPLLFLGAGLLLVQPCAADSVFRATGSLATERIYHSATLLPNGKVLVAGGTDNNFHGLASSELYDPATETWAATGSLHSPAYVAAAALLPNGKVLETVYNGRGVPATAELYDPASGTWTLTGSLVTTRSFHTATLLPNGKVLVRQAVMATRAPSRARNSTIR